MSNTLGLPTIYHYDPLSIIKISDMQGGQYGVIDEVKYKGENYVRKVISNSTSSVINEVYTRCKLVHPNMIRTNTIFLSNSGYDIRCTILSKKHEEITALMLLREQVRDRFIHQLIGVLSFLEINGLVHGDVKRENMLYISENGQMNLKLIDFGIMHSTKEYTKYCTQTIAPIDVLAMRSSDCARRYPNITPNNRNERQIKYSLYATGVTILWMLDLIPDLESNFYEVNDNIRICGKSGLKRSLIMTNKLEYYELLSKMLFDNSNCCFSELIKPTIGFARQVVAEGYHSKPSMKDAEKCGKYLGLDRFVITMSISLYTMVIRDDASIIGIIACLILCNRQKLLIDDLISLAHTKGIADTTSIRNMIYKILINSSYNLSKLLDYAMDHAINQERIFRIINQQPSRIIKEKKS